ncbi:thioredoxin family protein [Mycoplasmopsis cricetuli]|uniref:thioredoxin family protein n=1 Tax=Mycoplasmopsis cricetuli TaxID=171283 RepID=UPI000472526A|nr:thioredoxin family protein [Mycoplasmopsis cricetuli]
MKQTLWKDVQQVLNNNKKHNIIFLFFSTPNCVESKMMRTIIKNLIQKYKLVKSIRFFEIDALESGIYKNPLNKWRVIISPTFILVQNDEIFERGYNYIPEEVLVEWIEKRLSVSK